MRTVLVANRGEIAVRIVRACAELGLGSVAVYSDVDRDAQHVRLADHAVHLPGTSSAETYLAVEEIVDAARRTEADAVHPGYGFLAESAAFAAAVQKAGLTYVGPRPETVEALGDKTRARALAASLGIPVVPGHQDASPESIHGLAASTGWPLVVKAARGGGGRGMRVIAGPDEAESALRAARAEARAAFGDDTVHVEQYLASPRHVEVQILADAHGTTLALGDRDCSVQRRHQKLLEEAPAPDLGDAMRAAMADAAVRLVGAVGYVGAGTVEFLVEDDHFFFLEVNTRIQVEHPVTEAVLGLDLVIEQLRVAAGHRLPPPEPRPPRGHAVEWRLNAEDPARDFAPSPGTITALDLPRLPGIRFDTGCAAGDCVPPYYDSLVGKVIAWGPSRAVARHRLRTALSGLVIRGVTSTASAGLAVLDHPDFGAGSVPTHWFDTTLAPTLRTEPAQAEARDDEPEEEPDDTVVVAGRRYRLPRRREVGPGVARRRGAAPATVRSRPRQAAAPHVQSPMPGTVTGVLVTAGEHVAAGTTLVTVEAMKMEHPLRATAAAVVDEVLVEIGASISAGQLVVRLRDRSDEGATHPTRDEPEAHR